MISEYFIRERLDNLYDKLGVVWNELQLMGEAGLFDDLECKDLKEEYSILLEKIDLLHWVLGDEQNQIDI